MRLVALLLVALLGASVRGGRTGRRRRLLRVPVGAPPGRGRRFRRRPAALERAAPSSIRVRRKCGPSWGRFTFAAASPRRPRPPPRRRSPSTSTNVEGHRVLGLVYAGYADGGSQRGSPAQVDAVSEGRHHAPGAGVGLHAAGRPGPELHARPAVPARRHPGQGGAVADARGRAEPGLGAGAPAACAGAGGDQGRAGGDRDARGHRRRGAARGGGARPVSGAGRPAPRGCGHLHQGAGGRADEPRVEVPPHRRALQRQGLQGGGGVRRPMRAGSTRRTRASRACRAARCSTPAIARAAWR